jgi:hypothetical protein
MDIPNANRFCFTRKKRAPKFGVAAAAPRMATLREVSEERRKEWHGQPPEEMKPEQKLWRPREILL